MSIEVDSIDWIAVSKICEQHSKKKVVKYGAGEMRFS